MRDTKVRCFHLGRVAHFAVTVGLFGEMSVGSVTV